MNFKILTIGYIITLLIINFGYIKAQNEQKEVPTEGAKKCFDFNWQFHKGDIVMKRVIQVGWSGWNNRC